MTTDPSVVDHDDELDEDEDDQRGRFLGLWLVLAGIAALLLPATILAASLLGGDDAPSEMVVEIPLGTGDRIDAGEKVEILPEEVQLSVGDRIMLRNYDDRVHTVGPLTVRPGESLYQVFGQAGRFEGNCTLIPSKKVTIVVT